MKNISLTFMYRFQYIHQKLRLIDIADDPTILRAAQISSFKIKEDMGKLKWRISIKNLDKTHK